MILLLRQLTFNLFFYGINFITCVVMTPLLPFPRPFYMRVLQNYFHAVYWSERVILGLDYEVRGLEYLPAHPPYLVGAKHYSAYETLKLHLLFPDPAIVLKKELYQLPLWGWQARKTDMIAIDRSNREQAVNSIITGARKMVAANRPIIIFPQGTRVALTDTPKFKPYKGGIARLYESTNLPVIPLATNSGVFWGRNAFLKKPGKVIFQFLPPIPPGLPPATMMEQLQKMVEETSEALVSEAKAG